VRNPRYTSVPEDDVERIRVHVSFRDIDGGLHSSVFDWDTFNGTALA